MKKTLINSLVAIAMLSLISCLGYSCKRGVSGEQLAAGFVAPPDSIQTSIYWYWISNNISKEGIIKDLQSMKEAGINRAFIGNIGLDDTPYGNVKMLTDEWWDILHTALKTATELGIDIGIFNSPGWSQSGGPWVSEKEAMRYLTSTEIRVKGPVKLSQKLDAATPEFHDVKLVAFPEPKDDLLILDASNAKITSMPVASGLTKLVDRDPATSVNYPSGKDLVVDFTANNDFTARAITIRTSKNPQNVDVEFQVKEGGAFRTIKKFIVERYNPEINVGFDPYAPAVETFPATTAKEFRVILKNGNPALGVAAVEISAAPRIERYAEKTLAKMHQTPLPMWHEYQWVPQAAVEDANLMIDPAKVIDISEYLSADGTLNWDVPEGNWVIMRTGMTPTGTKNGPAAPEATGYEIDKMSKKHAAMHFANHMGEVLKRIPAEDRKSFKVVVQDSYEMGGQNFTDDFIERFKQEYGYDPIPFLPVYSGKVVGSQDASDRFLWDMRRLVANMIASEYVGGMREVSNANGLTTWLENYGHWGYPGESLLYGSYSDEIGGEYWSEGTLGDIENRIATSSAHIYGKNKISAESYTSGFNYYGRTPASIKQRGDRFFAEGINNSLLHLYIHQPYDKLPGINAHFATEFNRGNTWFSQMDQFTTYLKRVNFMLQQGMNVADIAYFIGEDAPKMTGVTDPAVPSGYQFDYINYDVIMNRMTVKDGLITLPHGTQYRMMVLPKLETMRPELLAKIKQLVEAGAIIYGPAPQRSPSYKGFPDADKQVSQMAAEMWSGIDGVKTTTKNYGKGKIINGAALDQVLLENGCIPDCKVTDSKIVHYGHRTMPAAEIYFLTNQTNEVQNFTADFRVTGKQPELWLPTTGEMRAFKSFEQVDNATRVPIVLQPNESVFVVFRSNASASKTCDVSTNYLTPTTLVDMKGPWSVTFADTLRGPKQPIVFEELSDWSKNSDELIKYYSGTAFYRTKFNLDKLPTDNRVKIELTDVAAMARVSINGKYVGGVWTPPYVLDITEFVTQGENSLEIEIVNTWVNHLIKDSARPESERTTWLVHCSFTPDSPLQKSGLIGPVLIQSVNQ